MHAIAVAGERASPWNDEKGTLVFQSLVFSERCCVLVRQVLLFNASRLAPRFYFLTIWSRILKSAKNHCPWTVILMSNIEATAKLLENVCLITENNRGHSVICDSHEASGGTILDPLGWSRL